MSHKQYFAAACLRARACARGKNGFFTVCERGKRAAGQTVRRTVSAGGARRPRRSRGGLRPYPAPCRGLQKPGRKQLRFPPGRNRVIAFCRRLPPAPSTAPASPARPGWSPAGRPPPAAALPRPIPCTGRRKGHSAAFCAAARTRPSPPGKSLPWGGYRAAAPPGYPAG